MDTIYNEFIDCSHNDIYNRYIFRGVPSTDYELIPSVLRKINEKNLCRFSGHKKPTQRITTEVDQISAEEKILIKFFSHCDYNGLKVPIIER